MERFAPNGVVRRRVFKADERFRDLLGEPTHTMKVLSKGIEKRALKFKKKHMFDPWNRKPREEPAKRYLYNKDDSIKDDDIPFITEYPNKIPRKIRREMKMNNFKFNLMSRFLRRMVRKKSERSELDDLMLDYMEKRSYGGF
jgi:hypothetical protein